MGSRVRVPSRPQLKSVNPCNLIDYKGFLVEGGQNRGQFIFIVFSFLWFKLYEMGRIGLTLTPTLDWNFIKNHVIENENNANLYIAELNVKAETALDNLFIDVSGLSKEELYYHLSTIIPLFCFFKYRAELEKYLASIFEKSITLNLLLNQKIDIALLYSTINNLEDDESVVLIFRHEAFKITYQYIDSLIKYYLLELIFPIEKNTNLIAKEFKLMYDLALINEIAQKKIRGKTKGRLLVLDKLLELNHKSDINLEQTLQRTLDFAKGKRKTIDKMHVPIIINCVVFTKGTSEYNASKLLMPLVNLICKSSDFSTTEDEWINKPVSPDKNYVSYCYKYIVNQFYR